MSEKKSPPKLPYKDLPALSETYADGFEGIMFNGRAATLVLTVNRFDEPKPPKPMSGVRVPVVRLVMDANCFIETYNQLHRLVQALAAQGVLQLEGQVAKPPRTMQ